MSRTSNSIRNSSYAIAVQILTVLLNFIIRTVFIKTLSVSYLGLNGLFTNILTVLSFAELGFGTAIVYAMYTPIAKGDYRKITAYMNFFAKVYSVVGLSILLVGLMLIPNLEFFISDTAEIPVDAPPLWLIYTLFLLNSAASYFFNYKRSLVVATQNGYLDSRNQLSFNLLKSMLQLLVLLVWKSYLGYLVIQILCSLLANIAISVRADNLFPYLRTYSAERLSKEEKRDLEKNVIAMTFHKLGSVVVSGVDNILISKFVGIFAMGCYSNYTLISSTINTLFVQIMSPITASVGNFVAEKTMDESANFFSKLLFVNAYVAVFCTSCLYVLSDAFIKQFWGEGYLLPAVTVAVFYLNFYVDRMRQTAQIYIDTNGLFWPIKWKSFIESIINLAASCYFLLVLHWGICGIILGTLTSNLLTNFWWEPYVVYKYAFKQSMTEYFKKYIQYFGALIVSIGISLVFTCRFPNTIWGFLFKAAIAGIVPNVVLCVCFFRTAEFHYFENILRGLLRKIRK